MTDTYVDGVIERENTERARAHRQNQIRSELLLRLLRKHHAPEVLDYNMKTPAGWEPRRYQSFKELWFGAPEEVVVRPPMIDEIKRTVCAFYGLTNVEITSSRRDHQTTRPRQIAMYLAKHLTGRSYPEIARRLGRSDHSTAVAAVKRVEKLCRSDWKIAHDVAHLERKFAQ